MPVKTAEFDYHARTYRLHGTLAAVLLPAGAAKDAAATLMAMMYGMCLRSPSTRTSWMSRRRGVLPCNDDVL